MTFRQLQIFRVVCASHSYSRAAEELALTQPAVSLQVRQLEELIGQPLFEYSARTLHLTPAAEALLRASEDVFGRLEALDMQLSDLQGALQGQLSLAIESSAQQLLPHLFAAFRTQHPEVSLQLTVVNHAQALRRLTSHRDDMLIISQPPSEPALDFFPFFTNPIIAVAAPQHPLCRLERLQLADLCAFTLLVREPGSGTRKACEEYCNQKRAHFAEVLELGSAEAQLEAAMAGLGLAMLSRHAARLPLSLGLLRELPVAELPLERSWCAVHPRGKHLSPVALAFRDFLQQARQPLKTLQQQLNPGPG